MNNPKQEQDICVNCGLCCDHTLFDIVIIQKDEFVDSTFTDNEIEYEGNRYFKLPCPYFKGCCTIYNELKPRRCGEYRCNILKRVAADELAPEKAAQIIREIILLRDEICAEYKEITGRNVSFRDINNECYRLNAEEKLEAAGLKILDFKANLLQMQLVKFFRSRQDFDDLYTMM